jgi:hypothetical protein
MPLRNPPVCKVIVHAACLIVAGDSIDAWNISISYFYLDNYITPEKEGTIFFYNILWLTFIYFIKLVYIFNPKEFVTSGETRDSMTPDSSILNQMSFTMLKSQTMCIVFSLVPWQKTIQFPPAYMYAKLYLKGWFWGEVCIETCSMYYKEYNHLIKC